MGILPIREYQLLTAAGTAHPALVQTAPLQSKASERLQNDYSARQNFNEKKSEKFSLALSSETVNICALEREANAFAIPKKTLVSPKTKHVSNIRGTIQTYI